MTKAISTSEKEQLMRDYWLGSMSADESEAFENDWFETDADAEILEVVRADLIGDYLSKSLSAGEKHLFEKNFLNVPLNIQDTAIAKNLQKLIDKEKVQNFSKQTSVAGVSARHSNWQKIKNLFSLTQWQLTGAISVAAVLLIGIFTVYLIFLRQDSSFNEVAETIPQVTPQASLSSNTVKPSNTPESILDNTNLTMPSESVSPKPDNLDTTKPQLIQKPQEKESKKPTPTPKPKIEKSVINFVLATALRDDANNKNILQIRPGNKKVRISFPMPGLTDTFEHFSVQIIQQKTGREIFSQDFGEELNFKKKNEVIDTLVSAENLSDGEYQLKFVGIKEVASIQKSDVLSSYTFLVETQKNRQK